MSNEIELNWDNLDEFIYSLPKDKNGRFLPNPNRYTLSTERDSVAVHEASKGMGNFYSEDLSEGVEVVNLHFGDGSGVAKMGASLIANAERKEGRVEIAEGIKEAFHLATESVKEKTNLYPETTSNETEALNDGMLLLAAVHQDLSKTEYPTSNDKDLIGTVEAVDIVNFVIANVKAATEDNCKTSDVTKNENGSWFNVIVYVSEDEHLDITLPIPLSKETMEIQCMRKLPELKDKLDLLAPIAKVREAAKDQKDLNLDPIARALRGLATLDTTEAEKEFAIQAENAERAKALRESGLSAIQDSPLNLPDMTPAQLKAWAENNVERAKGIVSQMDAHLEAGGRVNVADKHLMNCKADLNQLIPFKYNWSWSLYLTSCEHHWMPAEMALDRCVDDYKKLPVDIKKLVARAYMSHLSRKRMFPESVLLNIYRMISNPECRQYLLRQGMESVTVNHAWMEINESLGVKDTLLDGKTIAKALAEDNELFRIRGWNISKHIGFMHNYESETSTTESLAEFLKAFIILYTYCNWIMPLCAHYQVITALEFNETCQPLAQMFMMLNRDGISQFEFAKLFIAGVLEELPEINTKEWRDSVEKALTEAAAHELVLAMSLKAGENDLFDITYIVDNIKSEISSIFGTGSEQLRIQGDYTRGFEFMQVIKGLAPEVNHSAGLGTISW